MADDYSTDYDENLNKKDSLLVTMKSSPLDEANSSGKVSGFDLIGNRIFVPNKKFPYYSVDEYGNTKVNSLERNDFHWFTVFESIDGYAQSISGAGTIVCNPNSVDFTTGANNSDFCELQKIQPAANSFFTWDKDRKFKTLIKINNNTNVSFQIGTGNNQAEYGDSSPHIGFYLIGGTLWADTGDGVGESSKNLGSYSTTNYILLEAKFYHGVKVDFYVNGILKDTITTNLPSGTDGNPEWYFDTKLWNTGAGGAKSGSMVFWDFWQAN